MLVQFAITQLPITTAGHVGKLFYFLAQFPDAGIPLAVVGAILGTAEQVGSLARGMKDRQ